MLINFLKELIFSQQKMTDQGNIKMEFAAQIRSAECANAIRKSLADVENVEIDVAKGSVLVETALPWLEIHKRIEATGRRAVLTGFGGQSAVAMVAHGNESTGVQGVVRFCAISSASVSGRRQGTVVDGTIDGLSENGQYRLNIHECGDISQGCDSVGDIYDSAEISSDSSGRATIRFVNSRLDVDNLIGRSVVVAESSDSGRRLGCGIIARSAGIFENYKKICACDGVTIWDERNKSIVEEERRDRKQSAL
ncbi:copper chaperone for superoxide dismutase [Anopheles bellator]|uniref:copper chaperone for superoxide dismutase n=1 Tax=Anopheles bellator TaxID=139047 RepID=UPI0026476274|nr:copper chaperone for superoxide dismutase [Anopheles bellator]